MHQGKVIMDPLRCCGDGGDLIACIPKALRSSVWSDFSSYLFIPKLIFIQSLDFKCCSIWAPGEVLSIRWGHEHAMCFKRNMSADVQHSFWVFLTIFKLYVKFSWDGALACPLIVKCPEYWLSEGITNTSGCVKPLMLCALFLQIILVYNSPLAEKDFKLLRH